MKLSRSSWSLAIATCLLATAVSTPAGAQDQIDCSNAMTQMEMTQCADQDWQKADAKLNATYKKAMTKMREMDSYLSDDLKGAADTLREAQRAWIPYRDKACDAYGFLARGGTMEPMLVFGCRASLTEQRIKELEELIAGLGN